ncbi:hypothetical protein [Halomonas sp. A11-A]|uniref:hypothetical protein n=1 Tax=Halomonas sp. A11-A TaxID=2183985 RepID=UPI000D9EDC94|nr:hypothetical protein [Halomonas sp. A11-A]PWV76682.1 hypothetical protein DER72_10826 [Halomonas sp. A11-A]
MRLFLAQMPPPGLRERLQADDLPDVELEWAYNQVTLIHSINDGQGVRYASMAHTRAS